MPVWGDKPGDVVETAITETLRELGEEVSDDPSMEEVTGLPEGALIKHAIEAIAMYAKNHDKDVLNTPISLVQVYGLGFVVGTKYGELRARRSQDEMTPDEGNDHGNEQEDEAHPDDMRGSGGAGEVDLAAGGGSAGQEHDQPSPEGG